MTARPYKATYGRIVGRSHAATGQPCQDFAGARCSAGMGCIALADGAGSRARSELGAETVVRTALRMLTSQFDVLYGLCRQDPGLAQRRILGRLHYALARKAAREGCSVDAMACTFLFAAHKGARFIAGHIGDGVIAGLDGSGALLALSRPENGEYANTTVFVTDASACEKLRLYYGEADTALTGFVLMSDGCAESLYDRRSAQPAPAVRKLLAWNQTLSRQKMNAVLAANLAQSFSLRTADDCSLALLSVLHPTAADTTRINSVPISGERSDATTSA